MKDWVDLIFSEQLLLRWRCGYSDSLLLPTGLQWWRVCINSLGLELLPNWFIQPLLIDCTSIVSIVERLFIVIINQHIVGINSFIIKACQFSRMGNMFVSTFNDSRSFVAAHWVLIINIVSPMWDLSSNCFSPYFYNKEKTINYSIL